MNYVDKMTDSEIKAWRKAEISVAKRWIMSGRVLVGEEWPEFIEASIEIIEGQLDEALNEDGELTIDHILYMIGEETNSMYEGYPDDTFKKRANYAKTLYEFAINKLNQLGGVNNHE